MAGKMWELVDSGTYLGQMALIRYHFWNSDGAGVPGDLFASYRDDVLPSLVAIETTDYVHKSVIIKQVYPTVTLQQEYGISSGGIGTNGSNSAPGSTTYSVKWTLGDTVWLVGTPDSHHIKRGGKHLGGVGQNDIDGNTITAGGIITGIGTYVAALLGIIGDNWQLVIAHQPAPVAKVPQPVSKYAVVTGYVLQGVGSQVSRKPRHGK